MLSFVKSVVQGGEVRQGTTRLNNENKKNYTLGADFDDGMTKQIITSQI